MKKIILALLSSVLILLLLLVCGCQKEQKKAAKEMLLCSSLGETVTDLLVKDFTKSTGIKVQVEYLPAGSAEKRMQFLTSKNFDCWLGGTAEEYNLAGQNKLLERYVVKDFRRIPVELSNKQGDWTSLYLSHIALLSNKNNLQNKGIYAPETWTELLNPSLKGEIVIPDFKLGGASFGMITSIWQLKGKEQALSYAAKLHQQQPLYTATVDEAVEQVYKGTKTIAVVPISYALVLEEKHPHLFATIVRDANRNMLTGAALLKNGNSREEAQNFMDYLMSEAAIQVLANNRLYYLWHVTKNPYKDGRQDLLGKIQTPVDDLNWTATYKEEIIRQWLEAK